MVHHDQVNGSVQRPFQPFVRLTGYVHGPIQTQHIVHYGLWRFAIQKQIFEILVVPIYFYNLLVQF